ncbi:MAG: hypothetical protein ACXQTW_07340 [Candidatus Methanospirareceae archaeon]
MKTITLRLPDTLVKEHLEEIKRCKDIWISAKLCQKLIEAM